jgi:adenine deaminase
MIKDNLACKNKSIRRLLSLLHVLLTLILLTVQEHSLAQEIEILIKGGHVIDPKNKIDAPMDVAVANGQIIQVADRRKGYVCDTRIDRSAHTCICG